MAETDVVERVERRPGSGASLGARDIGSIIPDRSISGSVTPLVIGASESSLLKTRASVYETGDIMSPIRRQHRERDGHAAEVDLEPERYGQHDQDQALAEEQRHVAQRPADEHRHPAHGRDPHALHDALAHLVAQPEPHVTRAEESRHHEDPGDEDVEGASGREARHPGDAS